MKTGVMIEHLDELMQMCGYCDDESLVQAGFGCDHPDNSDKETIDGVRYGQCYPWACPIAMELCPEKEEEDRELLDSVYGKDGWKERLEHYMQITGKCKDE